jgi:small-conductance mechanosensitive channel
VRSSGTIISATVSLAYDEPHGKIEALLVQAAESAQLEKPYVHVLDLGNFAVTYRLAGFLANVKEQLSARSRLHACMLDALHGAGIEIVSPTFMNQRPLAAHERVLPAVESLSPASVAGAEATAETLAFDKAEHAAAMETMRAEITTLDGEIKDLEKRGAAAADDAKTALQHEIERRRARREMLLRGLELAEKARGEG